MTEEGVVGSLCAGMGGGVVTFLDRTYQRVGGFQTNGFVLQFSSWGVARCGFLLRGVARGVGDGLLVVGRAFPRGVFTPG